MTVFILNLLIFLIIFSLTLRSTEFTKNRSWYEFLPSIFWQGIIVASFLFQFFSFDQTYVGIQGISIAIFSIGIFLGDWLKVPHRDRKLAFNGINPVYFAYGLIMFSAALHLTHLLYMPEIPLVTKLTDKIMPMWEWLTTGSFSEIDAVEADARYMQLREKSSKLLDVPLLFIYICHGSLLVLAPFAISICLAHKKWLASSSALAFFLFYSRASLSKGTALLFMAIVFVNVWFLLPERFRKTVIKVGVPLMFVGAIYPAYFLFSNPGSLMNYQVPQEKLEKYYDSIGTQENIPSIITYGDRSRFFENKDLVQELKPREKTVNYFFYRAFLVPVEVSHFWYQYYPKNSNDYLGFYGLTPSTRNSADFIHPANSLGIWAYRARFPTHYLESVRAYCSIDADAHSRFGLWGVLLIAMLVLFVRLMWKFLRVPGAIGSGFYASFLFVFGSSLPAASIFAIMVAKGGALFILISLILIGINLEGSDKSEI